LQLQTICNKASFRPREKKPAWPSVAVAERSPVSPGQTCPWIGSGWRRTRSTHSLSEVFGTIAVRPTGSLWRKLTAFRARLSGRRRLHGPGELATRRRRLEVRLCALTIALISIDGDPAGRCARGSDRRRPRPAQACRDAFPRAVAWLLWVLTEIAICATDLAEVIGTAIGLNLLFGIPLEIGVVITALDVF
jgi:manganese transport protein